jgi:alginate O-acetyltransferase complex protein AlgI
MLFTSYKYALFVLVAFGIYWAAARLSNGRRLQNLTLLGLSYGFYALWDWRWCLLLSCVTASGFLGAALLARPRSPRKGILVGVLLLNLGALAAFKYFQFFAGSLQALLGTMGLHTDQVTLSLVLPVGISYYVFQNLSYVIDVYRRAVMPTKELLEYATALSFFPQLLAGPITRPRDLLPQLMRRRDFDDQRARDGLRQILWGLTKKMVIADNIGLQVDHVWSRLGSVDGLTLAISAVLYSIQIYCDFSGYADIAIGTAKLFNLRLSKNFDYPYFSTSVRAFWRRWHITLASWMRDYVYISLGGNRVSPPRQVFNVLVTFLLVGLWHGADWTFVIWGLLHGTYLAVETRLRAATWRSRKPARAPEVAIQAPPAQWRSVIAAVLVFALVTLAWIFFRAPSLSAAVDYFVQGFSEPLGPVDHLRYVPALLLSAALLTYEWFTRRWEYGLAVARLPMPVRWIAYAGLCLVILFAGYFGNREGIYVQF